MWCTRGATFCLVWTLTRDSTCVVMFTSGQFLLFKGTFSAYFTEVWHDSQLILLKFGTIPSLFDTFLVELSPWWRGCRMTGSWCWPPGPGCTIGGPEYPRIMFPGAGERKHRRYFYFSTLFYFIMHSLNVHRHVLWINYFIMFCFQVLWHCLFEQVPAGYWVLPVHEGDRRCWHWHDLLPTALRRAVGLSGRVESKAWDRKV